MNHNPYAAPATRVDDPAERKLGERPKSVRIAVWLLWIELALSLCGAWIERNDPRTPLLIAIVVDLILFAISIWLNWKIWIGRNWARITGLIWTLVWLPLVLLEVREYLHTAPLLAALTLIGLGLDAVALYLVFVPGRRWFAVR